jgi:hypothetical protein
MTEDSESGGLGNDLSNLSGAVMNPPRDQPVPPPHDTAAAGKEFTQTADRGSRGWWQRNLYRPVAGTIGAVVSGTRRARWLCVLLCLPAFVLLLTPAVAMITGHRVEYRGVSVTTTGTVLYHSVAGLAAIGIVTLTASYWINPKARAKPVNRIRSVLITVSVCVLDVIAAAGRLSATSQLGAVCVVVGLWFPRSRRWWLGLGVPMVLVGLAVDDL